MPSTQHEATAPRSRAGKFVVLLVVAAVALGGAIYYRGLTPGEAGGAAGAGKARGNGKPQPVSVAQVRVVDMPEWVAALGTAVPRNLVTVRSRVDGELIKLNFREGEMVKQGQPIAEIDPRAFEVTLAQANGQLAHDSALLKNAEIDLERYKALWAQDSIAKQQVDTQEALVRQYRGTVEVDRAQVDSARLQLSYTHISAPVSGRVGLRQVDPGNQVHASDTTGVAVIAQIQPMTVVFSVPETYLPALSARLAAKEPVVVEGWDREQKKRLARGRLLTIDNLVDTTTGTIKLKAEFANDDGVLFPNQFVNVRMLLGTQQGARAVAGAAIQRGAKGAFVYVLDEHGVVTAVPVVPGQSDGELTAIEGDLAAGARVVLDGADKLRDGVRVEVIDAAQKAARGAAGKSAKPAAGNGQAAAGEGQAAAGAGQASGQRRPERSAGGQAPAAN